MRPVTISAKFQILIPREVRESLGLRPGQQLQVIAHEGRLELIPVRPVKELRGVLRGIDTNVEREIDFI